MLEHFKTETELDQVKPDMGVDFQNILRIFKLFMLLKLLCCFMEANKSTAETRKYKTHEIRSHIIQ